MNFEETIKPLTELLSSNGFSIRLDRQGLIEYSSNNATLRIGYSRLEYCVNIWAGQSSDTLTELTPKVVKEFFSDDAFKFQTSLTVENLISFLKSSGKALLLGDTKILRELDEYSLQASRNYTQQIIKQQNINQADNAWIHKDYVNFIKYIDQIQTDLLPPSYLKKYKIALDKLNK
jgi:hypothetical protein